MNDQLGPLTSFILPGGSRGAARAAPRARHRAPRRAHRGRGGAECRSIRRRLSYLNRLSDYLFVAARHVNQNAGGDVLVGARRDPAEQTPVA